MGEPSVDFSAEGLSSSSCLCHNTCEPGCKHGCACRKDEYFEAVIACGQDDLVSFAEVMHIYDDEEEGLDLKEDSDDDDDTLLSLESDSADDLVADDTEVVITHALPSRDASESISLSDSANFSTNGPPKLVSAMKGTRVKQGIVSKLSVSWAPDVYDPPITSDSHTVRGHQRSSRAGHQKYKPSRSGSGSSSSSSRSTNGGKKDKKHSRHNSGSGSSCKKDKKHSYRTTISGASSRTDISGSHYRNAYISGGRSSRIETCVPESAKLSPWVPAGSVTLPEPEAIPVLKSLEQIKCPTSCGNKEKPFALLSRQFSAVKYKGMFSFWSQNQLAS